MNAVTTASSMPTASKRALKTPALSSMLHDMFPYKGLDSNKQELNNKDVLVARELIVFNGSEAWVMTPGNSVKNVKTQQGNTLWPAL